MLCAPTRGGPHERGSPAQPVAGVAATRPRDRWDGRALGRAGGLRDGGRGAVGRPGDHDGGRDRPRRAARRREHLHPRRGEGAGALLVRRRQHPLRHPGGPAGADARARAAGARPLVLLGRRPRQAGAERGGGDLALRRGRCLLRLRDDRGQPPRPTVHRARSSAAPASDTPGAPNLRGGEGPGDDPGWSGESSDGSYSSGDPEATPTDDGTYLRGAQATDANGVVRFTTIFPGWYVGRTTHIHCKVHIDRRTVLTTQLFFDDNVTDAIYLAVAAVQGATAARHPQRHRFDLRRRRADDDTTVGRRPPRRDQPGPGPVTTRGIPEA